MKKAPKLSERYDHYYIEPDLRYKQRESNPKLIKKTLENPNYLYEKLHD